MARVWFYIEARRFACGHGRLACDISQVSQRILIVWNTCIEIRERNTPMGVRIKGGTYMKTIILKLAKKYIVNAVNDLMEKH